MKLDYETEFVQKRTIAFMLYLINKSKTNNMAVEIKTVETRSLKFLSATDEIMLLQKEFY